MARTCCPSKKSGPRIHCSFTKPPYKILESSPPPDGRNCQLWSSNSPAEQFGGFHAKSSCFRAEQGKFQSWEGLAERNQLTGEQREELLDPPLPHPLGALQRPYGGRRTGTLHGLPCNEVCKILTVKMYTPQINTVFIIRKSGAGACTVVRLH